MDWYHDPVNGNDNYSGSNYTLLATAADGVTNGTTAFVSASALFTAGMVNHYVNILTKSSYKIIAFVNATTVTLSGSPAAGTTLTFYVGGPTKTVATNIPLGLAAGDPVKLIKSADPVRVQTSGGSNLNGTFTNMSNSIVLSGAATLDISICDATTNWTAGTNVTMTAPGSSTGKQGTSYLRFVTNSSFTAAGIIGYYATGSAIDLSAWQKICCWLLATSAVATGVLQIRLCSDTIGATPITTFNFGATTANDWRAILLDNGGAMSASVNSISIYATATFASKTIGIDNIFATNTCTLTALYGKGSTATGFTDGMYPARSIVTSAGTTTILTDQGANSLVSGGTPRGYYGTTETVAIYASEPLRMPTATPVSLTSTIDGTAANNILYSGGWNFTNGNQDGFTWIDAGDTAAAAVFSADANGNSGKYWSYSNFGTVRGGVGMLYQNLSALSLIGILAAVGANTNGISFTVLAKDPITVSGSLYAWANVTNGVNVANSNMLLTGSTIVANGNGTSGVAFTAAGSNTRGTVPITGCNNGSEGISMANANNIWLTGAHVCKDNSNYAVRCLTGAANNYLGGLTSSGNSLSILISSSGCTLDIGSYSPSEATTVQIALSYQGDRVSCQKYNGTATDSRTWKDNGIIQTDTGTRHTASGVSWLLTPNANATALYPLRFDLDAVAVDTTATVGKIWTQRDNTAIVNSFIILGGILPGVASDVTVTGAAAVNTWEQLTLASVTGTDQGGLALQLTAHAAGVASKKAFWDDISWS